MNKWDRIDIPISKLDSDTIDDLLRISYMLGKCFGLVAKNISFEEYKAIHRISYRLNTTFEQAEILYKEITKDE